MTSGELAPDFSAVLTLIRQAQSQSLRQVNRDLIELYWRVGEYLHQKTGAEGWGRGTVRQLAAWLAQTQPDLRGFSASNLWRMEQFYRTYRESPKLATLLRELSWSHNLAIMGRTQGEQEREFYLQAAIGGRWSHRELLRQMDGSLYERALTEPAKLSPALVAQQLEAASVFKDSYLLDFLGLPSQHSEHDLQHGLVSHLRDFLLELGPDFAFMGEQYRLQVGQQDF